MPISSVIPSPILETLKDSEETLRTTLAELAQDKRKQKPNISERKLAEYLADQMGYRGARNVEALVASRERIAKSRQAVGLGKKQLLAPEVAPEERFDPLPAIFGRLGIVLRLHWTDLSDRRQDAAIPAHEAVPGIRVNFHIVNDAEFCK